MYNRFMKGRPSLKGRTRLSDASNTAEQYRSAVLEPARAPRRKQIERLNPDAADAQPAWDWDDAALDLAGLKPRR